METLKGDKMRYGSNSHIPEKLVIIMGILIIIVPIIGIIYNLLLETDFVISKNNVIAVVFFDIIGLIVLYIGIKLKLDQKKFIDKFIFIKEHGLKAQGKIIKGYSYNQYIREKGVPYGRTYYQLKISYFDEQAKKMGSFITLPLSGDINKICNVKVDVYYHNGEAVFDNLMKGDNSVNFEEGIHRGAPLTDTEELKDVKNMEPSEMLKIINDLKKKDKSNYKVKCSFVTYENGEK